MVYRLSTAARDAGCNGIVDLLDAAGATIRFRTSTQPTNVGDADSGTLLGTVTFATPAFGASSTGVATAGAIASDTNADASGTAGHFRVYNGSAGIHSDGTAGTSGTDAVFDNNVIVAGGTIAVSAMTVTLPIS